MMDSFNLRASTLTVAGLAVAFLALTGCTSSDVPLSDCETGTSGCVCYGNDTCNDALRCIDSLCVADDGDGEDEDDAGLNGAENHPDAGATNPHDSGPHDSGPGNGQEPTDAGSTTDDVAGDSGSGEIDAGAEDTGVEDTGPEEVDHCEGVEAPAGAIFDPSRNTLPDFFGPGAEWANGISTGTELFSLNQYVSLQFVAPDNPGHVAWSIGGGITGGFRVRLSPCTREQAPEESTYCTLGEEGPWSNGLIDGTPDPEDWRCYLEPGETYYINIMLEWCPQSQCNFYGTLREI